MARRSWFLGVCGLTVALGASGLGRPLQSNEPVVLKPGVHVERAISGGETHTYLFPLASGQFMQLLVAQRGMDVELTLTDPDSRQLLSVNNQSGVQGTEWLSLIAGLSGDYRLQIKPVNKERLLGRYQVTIDVLHEAAAEDRTRVEAERIHADAEQFYRRRTADTNKGAIDGFLKALPLWQAINGRAEEAQALFRLGQIHSSSGGYRDAIKYFEQALPLRRATGDRYGEAAVLQFLGETYYYMGEYTKALDVYDRTLAARREVADPGGEAYALQDIGVVYASMGDEQKGLEFYERAFPLWRAAGDRRGEGLGYHNAASGWRSLGEFQKALDYYDRALTLRRDAGDRQGEAQTLSQIGNTHGTLGEFQTALEYFDRALPLRRLVGDRRGEGYTLQSLGHTHTALRQYRQGLDYLTQALSIFRAIGDRDGASSALLFAGETYAGLGELPKALDFTEEALTSFRAIGNRSFEADSLTNLGELYRRSRDYQKAAALHESALSIQRQLRYQVGEAKTLWGLARVERDRGELSEARAHAEAAIDLIESERTKVAASELRASFWASKQSTYEFYIDLLMTLHRQEPSAGHAASALVVAERGRSRSLLDVLAEARVDIRQGLDAGLLEREKSLHQDLNLKAERLTRMLSGKHLEEQANEAEHEVDTLLGQMRQLQAQIRTSSPRYAALTAPAPLGLSDIQRQILDDDSVLLEYSLGEERSYLWAVTPTSLTSYELPPRVEVESAARRTYELLTVSHLREPRNQVRLETERLAKMVLGPVSDRLGDKRLLIVADGALQYVPFGALPTPNARTGQSARSETSREPLLARHEIVYLPSTSSLAALRHGTEGRPAAPGVLAVLADPVLDDRDPRVKPATRAGTRAASYTARPVSGMGTSDLAQPALRSALAGLERLRFTRQEAEGIIAIANSARTLKALDFDASRETAIGPDLRRYRIVHFATHAFLNDDHPELSGVVLSLVGAQGQPVDGFLRLHDIYNLKLDADLVVLSACRTALGKEVRGEGLIGLTRGFMHAGAPRVVASLWDVRDEATAELMRRFYRYMLQRGFSPAAALRAAQVSMWREPRWEAPYYWAPFLLHGDWK